jgi:hypothetical protein
MSFSEALREEHFEWLSHQLRTCITKEDFCLPIYHHHRSSLIDGDQGIRRNVQELE